MQERDRPRDQDKTVGADEGEEIQAVARRRGEERSAGADTPSGPDSNRTTARHKQELERREREGHDTSDLYPSGPNT
jgi:hypothetical protein